MPATIPPGRLYANTGGAVIGRIERRFIMVCVGAGRSGSSPTRPAGPATTQRRGGNGAAKPARRRKCDTAVSDGCRHHRRRGRAEPPDGPLPGRACKTARSDWGRRGERRHGAFLIETWRFNFSVMSYMEGNSLICGSSTYSYNEYFGPSLNDSYALNVSIHLTTFIPQLDIYFRSRGAMRDGLTVAQQFKS